MKIEWRHLEGCLAERNPDHLCRCPRDPWEALAEAQVALKEALQADKAARACLRRIREWDMISPPDRQVLEDGPWLAGLIDGVLDPARSPVP
jgi:hypothetical protein